jgi:ribA/ribD-fused uncharacterized protein
MAKKLAQAVVDKVFDLSEHDLRPDIGAMRGAVEELERGDFLSAECFVHACFTLRQVCENCLMDPDAQNTLAMNPEDLLDVLSASGMEESIVAYGWQSSADGSYSFTGTREDLQTAVRQIAEAEAWVRRRGVRLVTGPVTKDNEGKSVEFHHPKVLLGFNKFKGAVWHMSHASCRPDGVLTFHNSPFSNFHLCGSGIRIRYSNSEISFSSSEAMIMAFKLHLVLGIPLSDALTKMSNIREAADAKKEANSEINSAKNAQWDLWGCHATNVLVGAVACLPKFLQDEGLSHALLSTQSAVLIEAAPHDGNWGVGKNSYDFFCQDDPQFYSLRSQESSELSFMKRDLSWSKRRKCEANALGKALMVVRAVLPEMIGPEPMELHDILVRICRTLKVLDVPFDWKAPGKHLKSILET